MEHRKRGTANNTSSLSASSSSLPVVVGVSSRASDNDDDNNSSSKIHHSHPAPNTGILHRWRRYYGPTIIIAFFQQWWWCSRRRNTRVGTNGSRSGDISTTTSTASTAGSTILIILIRILFLAGVFISLINLMNRIANLNNHNKNNSQQQQQHQANHQNYRILYQPLDHPVIFDQSPSNELSPYFLPYKPRVMGVYFGIVEEEQSILKQHNKKPQQQDSSSSSSSSSSSIHHHQQQPIINSNTNTNTVIIGTESINPNVIRCYRTHTRIDKSSRALKKQELLYNSKEYNRGRADSLETKHCKKQYDWQLHSYPTCNLLLEIDWTSFQLMKNGHSPIRLVANGYWRDVWRIVTSMESPSSSPETETETFEKFVLKTIRYEHDFEPRNYDRHRRDAVAMERLSFSSHIIDIYGYCGNSGLFEFADGGDIGDRLWDEDGEVRPLNPELNEWTPQQQLQMAYQLAAGLADVHNFASPIDGIPAIAHTDITPSQFVYVKEDDTFKLNDFNRCRFITWNKQLNQTCPFHIGNNPGMFRSPEEYRYDGQTVQIDVYSLGNVFYTILTKEWPFENEVEHSKDAQKLVKEGQRPIIVPELYNSTEPYTQALVHAIRACWIHDPTKRATSRQIEQFLGQVLAKLNKSGGNGG